MKESVRVAVVQMNVRWGEPSANLACMRRAMEQISDRGGADLVVFPELANSGYLWGIDRKARSAYFQLAEPISGPFVTELARLARRYHIQVVTGFLEAHPSVTASLYNSAVLIDSDGAVVGVHHKVHIPNEEKHWFYAGSRTDVFRTKLGTIALEVCADALFPELARIQSLKGAEIICAVFNADRYEPLWGPPDRLRCYAVMRSLENREFFLCCNRVGDEDGHVFVGRSAISSPIGSLLASSETEDEEILFATLERQLLYEARASYPIYRDRRPELYGLLSEPP
jgi:predicted amidohydrolase